MFVESPTAAQSLHHLLNEGGRRLAGVLGTERLLLVVQCLVPWAANAVGKVGIRVLELRLG